MQCHANADRAQSDNLAQQLLPKQTKQFWTEINKLTSGNFSPLALTVDDANAQGEINCMWKKHYESILNCSQNVTDQKEGILKRLDACANVESPVTPLENATVMGKWEILW